MPPGRDSAPQLGRAARWCGLSVHPRQKSLGTPASELSLLLAGQTRSALWPTQKRAGRRSTAMRAELAQGMKPALQPALLPLALRAPLATPPSRLERRSTAMRVELAQGVKPALRPALLRSALPPGVLPPALRPALLPLALPPGALPPALRPALLRSALPPGVLPALSSAGPPMASRQRVWQTLRAWARMAVRPDPRWSCPMPGCRSTFPSWGRCAFRADAASGSGDRASRRARRVERHYTFG